MLECGCWQMFCRFTGSSCSLRTCSSQGRVGTVCPREIHAFANGGPLAALFGDSANTSIRVSSTTQPRTTRTDSHLSWKYLVGCPSRVANPLKAFLDHIMCHVCTPTTSHSNPGLPDHVMDAVRLMPPITSRGGAFVGDHSIHTLTLHTHMIWGSRRGGYPLPPFGDGASRAMAPIYLSPPILAL